MDAPADAPRSENRAFGRPRVNRRAGLSSSSVVGLSAVSIRAISYVGAAPRSAEAAAALYAGQLCSISPNLRDRGFGASRASSGAPEDVTNRSEGPERQVVKTRRIFGLCGSRPLLGTVFTCVRNHRWF